MNSCLFVVFFAFFLVSQMAPCKIVRLEIQLKMKAVSRSYLGNKDLKAMFPVVSLRLNRARTLVLRTQPIFCVSLEAEVKLHARKIGRDVIEFVQACSTISPITSS